MKEDLNPHNLIDLEIHLDNYDYENYIKLIKNRHFIKMDIK